MSITFTPDLEGGIPTLDPCMCTQMHEDFVQWVDYGPGSAAVMESAANEDCHQCQGTGLEQSIRAAYPELNMSNEHAWAVLQVMGLKAQQEGSMTLVQARRGLIRARARTSLEAFTAPKTVVGRFFDAGVTEVAIAHRIEKLSKFVELVASLGATRIFWY